MHRWWALLLPLLLALSSSSSSSFFFAGFSMKTHAFPTSGTTTTTTPSRMMSERFRMASIGGGFGDDGKKRKPSSCRCPDDNENDDENEDGEGTPLEDRREAFVAALGWAAASAASAAVGPARATAGADANMAFPDVLGGMADRASKECLVESLGTRECMVYKETDPDKLLYKGVDGSVLLKRAQAAATALEPIPSMVDVGRWNDVQGTLIGGPMGELSKTMTLLSKDDPKKTALARKVKDDLFAMGTAAQTRRSDDVRKHHAAATRDLAKFLEAAAL
eukprot:CAMPEP_0197197776 /NCGR_PEP_ID=MMETSP1423-20130617/33039_1 /TAXON_ID=476441 /ORGANISM="Pseudo-nitzschia heimii, Strain UNC1101" /LENGTH=277 /DNA_ID=CAMNT_0042651601 /DNA_START=126 /DNA_END=959 /DNA_ORIENTATION=+